MKLENLILNGLEINFLRKNITAELLEFYDPAVVIRHLSKLQPTVGSRAACGNPQSWPQQAINSPRPQLQQPARAVASN